MSPKTGYNNTYIKIKLLYAWSYRQNSILNEKKLPIISRAFSHLSFAPQCCNLD